MAKIGIGVTTYNRPECLKECLEHIIEFSDMKGKDFVTYGDRDFLKAGDNEITIHVATDTDEDRRGVAYRKNECLRALKDCDYVFLFDDDCFPIKDGWIDFFINSGQSHLLYMVRNLHGNARVLCNLLYFDNCGGAFMFMTKQAIDKVGAFNEKFEKYGFEHAEYSIRILGDKHDYPMLRGTEQYIYSHDYSTPNHKSSITDEEKRECVKNNWDKFFNRNIENIYLPL